MSSLPFGCANTRNDPARSRASCTMRSNSSALSKDRKSTRLNSSHLGISYAVFCLKKIGLSYVIMIFAYNSVNDCNRQKILELLRQVNLPSGFFFKIRATPGTDPLSYHDALRI